MFVKEAQSVGNSIAESLPELPENLVVVVVCVFTLWVWYENLRVYLLKRRLARMRQSGAYAEKDE